MNNELLAVFGAWVQAIGTTLSAIGSTSSLNINKELLVELNLLGNVLQATGNSLEADSEKSFTLNKLGNEVQAIGNLTVITGILIDFNNKTKQELNIKGNLIQAVGGSAALADALENEPLPEELYSIYGNLLQVIGNSLQAISGINELKGRNGQSINEVGSWIQATGSVIAAIGQSKNGI